MTDVSTLPVAPPQPESQHLTTAAFEAIMLVRCAQPGSLRRGSGQPTRPELPDDVFIEFSRPDAADRLVALLDRLGHRATGRVRIPGVRERRPIYQVVLAPGTRTAVDTMLHDAWRVGLNLLCQLSGGYLPPRRRRLRDALAAAAWRAAILAAGYRRGRGPRGFYIGDHATMAVLIRAGRVLNFTTTAQRRPGCHLLQVTQSGPHAEVARPPAEVARPPAEVARPPR